MATAVEGASGLQRALTMNDLVAFGVAAIMGEGGFNLISQGVVQGGPKFPLALGGIAALFQGASKVYSEAFKAFPTNTAESDVVHAVLGRETAIFTAIAILAFNLISVSAILVLTAKNIAPEAGWWSQIALALGLLTVMTTFSLEGIQLNKQAVFGASAGIVALLMLASGIGLAEGFSGKGPGPFIYPHVLAKTPNFLKSLLFFYFILAGFDDIIKFVDETKEPMRDIPRSFYATNALCALLVIGVSYAYLHVLTFKRDAHYHGQNALGLIVESAFGVGAGRAVYWIGIFLMLVTAFVSFLAVTRYVYSLADRVDGKEEKNPSAARRFLLWLRELNEKKVPWRSVLFTGGVVAAAALVNHVDFLVNASDFFLSLILIAVSAAVTIMRAKKGEMPIVEGLTTVGFVGLLSASFLV
jgi:amino acid transporter